MNPIQEEAMGYLCMIAAVLMVAMLLIWCTFMIGAIGGYFGWWPFP